MLRGTSYKNIVAFVIDTSAAFFASLLCIYLRLGFESFIQSIAANFKQSFIFMLVAVLVNFYFSIHRGIWRYFNSLYFFKIVKASTITVFLFLLFLFMESRLEAYPRSVIFLSWFFLIFFTAAPRALYRYYYEGSFSFIFRNKTIEPTPLLLVGLGNSTENFISQISRLPEANYRVIGIIDEKINVGRTIYDIPVIGTITSLKKVISKLEKKKKIRPARILISHEFYLGGKLQNLLQLSEELSIPVSKLPKLNEIQHDLHASPIQSIPVEDLLRRSQRVIDRDAVNSMIEGKRILITGAGGSIGSEIVRQVCAANPKEVLLLDISEFLLYEIQQEAFASYNDIKIDARIADIRNDKNLNKIFEEFKPEIVFHAAALKHVPLLEDHKIEAVSTNVIGTKNVLNSAKKVKAEKFVFISTDKAVNPSSFMGSTKRLAEMLCQDMASKQMKISIVRFGNVLASNGSVVPIFEKQIASGGPITVTHPEATRYFMTIKEAVGLVLQSSVLHKKELCKVFVLDMGEPIKILDLAYHMIRLAGFKPDVDIKVKFIGLRPGEKLHETLFYENEDLKNTENSSIFLAKPKEINHKNLTKKLSELEESVANLDSTTTAKIVNKMV